MTSGGGPPGFGGGAGGFGDVGQAVVNYQGMDRGMRLKDIENNVEMNAINMAKYVRELSKVRWDMFRATGAMFEQEHVRFINMFAATGGNGLGGGATKDTRRLTEH